MTPEAAVAAVALVVLGQGKGDGVPELSLDIDPCVPVPAERVLHLTELELEVRVVPPSEARPQATKVRVSCTGEHLTLRVSDPMTGKHLERTLALTTAEVDVAGRTVALAVSELVLTSWMELTLKESRSPPPAAEFPTPSAQARSVARQRAEQSVDPGAGISYVTAAFQLVGPFRRVGLGWGAGAHLGWRSRTPWLGAELGLDGSFARTSVPTGTISVSTWSLALRAAIRFGSEKLWFDTGPGLRVGIARLQGTPDDPNATRGNTFAGTFAGPIVYAGLGITLGSLVVTSGAEAGYIMRDASGLVDDGREVAIGDAWIGGRLGFGFAP
jgi:hypothetical protein